MKLLIIFSSLFFTAFCNKSLAQQNVGIGTTSPSSMLDVGGAINTDSVYKIGGKTIIRTNMFGSIFIGEQAGEAAPFDANERNVYIGWRSGLVNTYGYSNSFFGTQAGEKNKVSNNSFFGSYAGQETDSGSFNSYFGVSSGTHNVNQQMNSFFGYLSGSSYSQTGGFNSIMGAMSGVRAFIGDRNTLLGYDANTVSNAVFSINNSTAIGFEARLSASNQMRFGNGNITSIGGYVGWSNLSDARFKKNIQQNVPGLLFINKLQPVTYNLDLEKLDNFFNEPDSNRNDKQYQEARKAKELMVQSGLIAQDVEKVAKEVGYEFSGIDAPGSAKGNYNLRYAEFVVPLIKAVQELSKQNEELRKQVEEISNRLKTK